eukprot:3651334-Prymnesium_polylepis.1
MPAAVSQPLSSSVWPAEAGQARGRTRRTTDDMASLRVCATFLDPTGAGKGQWLDRRNTCHQRYRCPPSRSGRER